MRIHKYKAWDRLHKDMSRPFELGEDVIFDCTDHAEHKINCQSLIHSEYDGARQFIVLEYTGLDDSTMWQELTEEEQVAWIDSGGIPRNWKGKQIYEGDICKVHVFTQELGENMGVVEGEHEFIAKIVIGSNGCGVILENNEGDSGPIWAYDGMHEGSFKLIGTILENPELMKLKPEAING